ncbi:MAG: radical SAM protein, partial [Myxococcota bacterium]
MPRAELPPLELHPVERLPEEWTAVMAAWGEARFRASQVFLWIHKRGVLDAHRMKNLPRRLRDRLAAEGLDGSLGEVSHRHRSDDETQKLLVRLHDGKEVETVLIPQLRALEDDEQEGVEVLPGKVPGGRITQCISSQVGCAMGCVFCASGIAGLKRHLSAAEIVAQVLVGRAALSEGQRIRNVVFMGMGEPLHNYPAVARALKLLTHEDGIHLSTRRITVSTSGLVPEIGRLGEEFGGRVQLAISLHQTD